MPVGLVLAAGGSGSRLGGVPKQIRPLAGRPVLNWSLAPFRGLVDEVVIVSAQPLITVINELIALEPPAAPWRVIAGGATRLASVAAGINALSPTIDTVLVHDAARPLIQQTHIIDCLNALGDHRAAVLACPCHATVKRCRSGTQHIQETVDRQNLWLAQTPQAFRRRIGQTAFAQALQAIEKQPDLAATFTDDVSVLAWAGIDAVIVPGPTSNLKITDDEDWQMAEAVLQHRHALDHQ